MVNASASKGASSQPPSSVKTCSPPLPACRSRMVTVPKSVCGPMRNWPGSGSPTTSVPGYQLMLKPYVGWSMCFVKKSGSRPRASPSSARRWFSSSPILVRYSSQSFCSSGASAGHTFGAYHSALISGSSNSSCVANVSDSLRSGGVSVPSE